jgi:acyl transferase domain-containing protein
MTPAAIAARPQLDAIRLNPPRELVYSGYTGEPLTDKDALRPEFWAWQVVDTVQFGPALDRLLADCDGGMVLVEVGPGQTLTSFARRHRAIRSRASEVHPLLPTGRGDRGAMLALAKELGTP